MMGNTLHNKIYLGRSTLPGSLLYALDSRQRQAAAVALGVLAGAGLVWAARRVLR
jgi:hypothetical protein